MNLADQLERRSVRAPLGNPEDILAAARAAAAAETPRRRRTPMIAAAAALVLVGTIAALTDNDADPASDAPTDSADADRDADALNALIGSAAAMPAFDQIDDLLHNTQRQIGRNGPIQPYAPDMVFVRADIIAVDGWYSVSAEPRDDGLTYADDMQRVPYNGRDGWAKVQFAVSHDFSDPEPAPTAMWIAIPPGGLAALQGLVDVDDAVIIGSRTPPPGTDINRDTGSYTQLGTINPIGPDGQIDWAYPDEATTRVPFITDLEERGSSRGEIVTVADDTNPPTVINRRNR